MMKSPNDRRSDAVALLRELIAIPSVNPEMDAEGHGGGERALAEFVAGLLFERGFSSRWVEATPGRPNLISSFGPEAPRRTVVFESHLDTVGVQGMTRPPFEAVLEDGRLYGRGACDTKGPMAAALAAFADESLDRAAEAGVRIVFLGVIGEETGNQGAKEAVADGLKADAVIVLEPTDLAIVHAHKGALWVDVEATGRAAHGSNPAMGLNAILGMTRFLQGMQEQIAADREAMSDPLLGSPTLNVGVISGGSAPNIVPDRCVARLDRRLLPGESAESALEAMRLRLEALKNEGAIEGYSLKSVVNSAGFHASDEAPLIRDLSVACEDVLGRSVREGAGWYSDAGYLAALTSEVAVFGPGSIRQAHTADEYIEVESLLNGERILRRFLDRLAAGGGGAS